MICQKCGYDKIKVIQTIRTPKTDLRLVYCDNCFYLFHQQINAINRFEYKRLLKQITAGKP